MNSLVNLYVHFYVAYGVAKGETLCVCTQTLMYNATLGRAVLPVGVMLSAVRHIKFQETLSY